jgi:hypothetical protein
MKLNGNVSEFLTRSEAGKDLLTSVSRGSASARRIGTAIE